MSVTPTQRVLYVIACGGPPAGDLPQFVAQAQGLDWDVCVISTPSGLKFIDAAGLAEQTGHPVRSDYKQPDEPDVLPPADAFVVAPATFNTINKLAAGISDTLALGLLNEGLGGGKPIIAVPFPNQALARHPAFVANLAALRSWGVELIFDPDPASLPEPVPSNPANPANPGDSGNQGSALFPWTRLVDALSQLGSNRVASPADRMRG
ncbi:MAG TPA: flavoprotein [Streptosporangiaceae bacterium]|nr:flavoprotein [Streptosporangiaceae bacterium]